MLTLGVRGYGEEIQPKEMYPITYRLLSTSTESIFKLPIYNYLLIQREREVRELWR